MSWFTDKYKDYEDEAKRLQAMELNAGALFNEVWRCIQAISAEAAATGLVFTSDEAPAQCTLTMEGSAGAGERKLLLVLDLAKEKRIITGQSDSGHLELPLAVDDKCKVSLSLENQVVEPRQAAEKIMESFLFHGESPYAVHVKHVE